jgi:hypothetical protein
MTSTIKFYRSSSTAITPGVTTLAFGQPAFTDISGVRRFYVGNSSNVAVEIAGAAYALLASPAFTGTPTAPTASAGTNTTQLATTAFVTSAVSASAAGLVNKGVVVAATTAALPANTYNNGSSGVGATLTGNSNGALPDQDGVTLTAGDTFLVKNEVAAANNGLYVITDLGDGSNPYELTRAANFNSSTNIVPNSIVTISTGVTLADQMWWITLDGAVVVGTTPLDFSQFGVGNSYSAGDGLDLTDSEFSVLYDNATIAINGSNQVIVKTGGITETQINSSTLLSSGGLQGGSGTKVSVKADVTTGATVAPVSVGSNGVGVAVDNSSITHSGGTISVSLVDGGTF